MMQQMTCPSCNAENLPGMRFCGMCGSALLPQLSGRERRRVTVVFVDLVGFSSLTQGYDPERLRDLADETLTVVAGIIEDYDGHVDAFRGDGLIALFGAPRSHPDDPQRAVLAAAASLRAIEAIGRSKGLPLQGRAGVNTGVVIAGAVGSGKVRDYTVMGSAVNLASRLESAAGVGEVWVGSETYEATRHLLRYEATPGISLRGFPEVTEAWRFVGSDYARIRDPYEHLRFVGRERELSELARAFDEVVRDGRPLGVWLCGEAGIGKSRLLKVFGEGLCQTRRAKVVWYRDVGHSRDGEPKYFQLAEQLFPVTISEGHSTLREKIKARLHELFGDRPELERTILGSLHLLERRSRPRLDEVSGKHRRRPQTHVAQAWREVILAITRQELGEDGVPIVIIDVRSRDQDVELLTQALEQAEASLLLLQTSRTRPTADGVRVLALSPLELNESLELLTQLANPLLEVATRSLVSQVGGIPSYVLELGRALSITPTGSFSGSLASLLQARLDMLTPGARQLLAAAALVGERCWESLLLQLAPQPESLRELVDEQLLIAESGSSLPETTEYRFQSELLRNAVLRMIPFSDRPALHQRIASYLEEQAPLDLSPLIGYHFEQAGAPEAAYPHYLTAADTAAAEGDFDVALDLFEHLLSLPLPPDLLAQGSLAYLQVALAKRDFARAEEQLKTAQRWLERCDPASRGELQSVFERLRLELAPEGQP